MKLPLLFLIAASPPLASIDLALASGESEWTKADEFNSVRGYLRASPTIEQEDEERANRYDAKILTDIKEFFSTGTLPGFPYDSITKFAKLYSTIVEYEAALQGAETDIKFMMSLLFKDKILEELRLAITLHVEKYINIALYLVLLEKVDGSTFNAALEIDKAIREKSKEIIASRMEDGQFHLWNHVVGTEEQARTYIFGSRKDHKWRNEILERYQKFLANQSLPGMEGTSTANEKKRRMPGMEETSTENEKKRRMPGMEGTSTSRF